VETALEEYQRAVAIDPNNATALKGIALLRPPTRSVPKAQ